jgi:hypothetical protein
MEPADMNSILIAVALCMTLPIVGNRPSKEASSGVERVQGTTVNPDAKALAEFKTRVDEYVALHKKIEDALPKLSNEATPEEIDRNQRNFAQLVATARKNARVGDVFTPAMQIVARRLMERLFQNTASRRQLRESLMDDNPSPSTIKLAVNGRYPDHVPLSTMPPEVLKGLPTLPEELEFRFVGETLILLDPHAHIVVDYVTRALPR